MSRGSSEATPPVNRTQTMPAPRRGASKRREATRRGQGSADLKSHAPPSSVGYQTQAQRADTKIRAPAALVVVPRGPRLLVGYRSDGSAHRGSPIPEGSQKLAGGRAKRHPRSTALIRCRHPGGVRESVAKQHGAVRGQPI